MELIYMYIDSFRNFKNVGIALSDKFTVLYDSKEQNISIIKNTNHINIYPSYIQNISAIVGKNSVGKTNLIDLIGMKIDDRNKNNAENKITYEMDPDTGLRNRFVKEEKFAKYFMIYHLNDYEDGDKFFFEGNFIEDFNRIVLNKIPGKEYFESKPWYSFVCKNINQKLEIIYNTQDWSRHQSNDNWPNTDILPYVLSFRNNYNPKIYNYNSYKPTNDNKISIPRRIARTNPNLWIYKLSLLVEIMSSNNIKGTMYRNKEYEFCVEYNGNYTTEEKTFSSIYKELPINERKKAKIIESFLSFTYYQINDSDDLRKKNANVLKAITNTPITYSNAISYYENLFLSIMGMLDYTLEKNELEYATTRFKKFIEALDNPCIEIKEQCIVLKITAESDISQFENIIQIIDDDYRYYEGNGLFSIFSNFFECRINYLSDGESYFLGLISSIAEQLSDTLFCKTKKHFILLFDEPETNMHPDLARSFIYNLIDFLANFPEKFFHIIIATHSPFILSDLLESNVQMLIKEDNGNCNVEPCNISTFCANIHEILSNSFFMSSTIGAYSKNILDSIIKALKGNDDPKKYGLDKNKIDVV